jgi:predicted nucleotide-binding protein
MNKPYDNIQISQPIENDLESLSGRIRNGEILLAAVHQVSKNPGIEISMDDLAQSYQEWFDHSILFLAKSLKSQDLFNDFSRQEIDRITKDQFLESLEKNLLFNLSFMKFLKENIPYQPDKADDIIEPGRLVPDTKDVFIIHGHDDANRLRLQKILEERCGLNIHLMINEPGRGRTLIDKFEEEAQLASYAFALLTPDDLVKVKNTESEYAQARPNAIFELGWFYGRLGRHRITILFKEGTHLHSDLAGISRIEFSNSVEECIGKIEAELGAAGLIP